MRTEVVMDVVFIRAKEAGNILGLANRQLQPWVLQVLGMIFVNGFDTTVKMDTNMPLMLL